MCVNFCLTSVKKGHLDSVAVQWLRLRAFTTWGVGCIPAGELKIPQTSQCGQKNNMGYLALNWAHLFLLPWGGGQLQKRYVEDKSWSPICTLVWVRKEHLFEPLHFWVFWFGNMLEFPCTPVLDILLLAAHIGRLRLIPLFLVEPLHHIIRKSAWEVNILGAEFLCIWPVFILPESVWIFVSCALICVFSAIVLNTEPPPHFF